jgi:hypothetical protein
MNHSHLFIILFLSVLAKTAIAEQATATQASPDLTNWTNVDTNASSPLHVTTTATRAIYRVVGQ